MFVCSSLEPGRDGVGDYTRRLAGELIRQGHECRLLSLNEKVESRKLKEENRNEIQGAEVSDQRSAVRSQKSDLRSPTSGFAELQQSEGTSVECLRLPGSLGRPERAALARQWVGDFNPDWVSLQYVCYGFHPKGLTGRWNPVFAELGDAARHRHLMFHELWVGPPPFHRRLIGWGQQCVIRDLHRRFRPSLVTTNLPAYQERLSGLGIMAKVLPLFGNVPLALRDDQHIAGLLQAAGSRLVQKPRGAVLNGVFFGTVHPDFAVAPLKRWLVELQSRTGRSVLLSLIGRVGAAAEFLTKQLGGSLPEDIEVVSLGEQPVEIISQALQFADFGINTGSPEYLGKSSTFAAMQEHGLPVVLGDGEVESTILKNGASPVLQFSTGDSVAVILNYTRLANANAGLAQTAANMICHFESVNITPM